MTMISDGELKSVFEMHTVGHTIFSRRMAINIADWFNIPVRDLVRRLERDGLVKEGTWDWFAENGGITVDHVKQVRETRS